METRRLYYFDSFLTEFEAQVVERREHEGKLAAVLDQTAFYPTSGGQPNDTGFLGGVEVLDVIEDGEQILHILAKPLRGDPVEGKISWDRRFDHMQQHTGQHMLSQSFYQRINARTVGFHLGEEICTIDLDVPKLEDEVVDWAEERCNQVIFEDRSISTKIVSASEVEDYNLRKEPGVKDNIRLIIIDGFDTVACGGTHCKSTGQVGIVKIRKCEKVRLGMRVEFYCGKRALLDYRWKNRMMLSMSSSLTVKDREVEQALGRLRDENKNLRLELGGVKKELLALRAGELIAAAESLGVARVVAKEFNDLTADDCRTLANNVAAHPGMIALLGTTAEKPMLVATKSKELKLSLKEMLSKVRDESGGKGGGSDLLFTITYGDVEGLRRGVELAVEGLKRVMT